VLTQKQLAEALGVESITISRWERRLTTPSLSRLQHVAEVTGMRVSDLLRADARSEPVGELAALREELAETRELIDRIAQAVDRLARARGGADAMTASRES